MLFRMILWQSRKSIESELSRLRAQADALAGDLCTQCTSSGQLVHALMPLTRQIVALEAKLLKMTPYAELVERRAALQQKLDACPHSDEAERSDITCKLARLDWHLLMRRKPMTLKDTALFILMVMALFLLERLLAG